jgi:putative membrane protein
MVALWGSIITGGVFLLRSLVRQGQRRSHEDSALEILKRRYARGEIGKQEYEEKRSDLT